jgi:hypothetical protein
VKELNCAGNIQTRGIRAALSLGQLDRHRTDEHNKQVRGVATAP